MRKRQKTNMARIALFIGFLPIIMPILIIVLILKILKKLKRNKTQKTNNNNIDTTLYNKDIDNSNDDIYHKKELLTECEKKFLDRLKRIFGDKYIIQPQIPLRMIISKNGDEKGLFAGELNRYIDFGLFDKNYQLLALIELNDKTHTIKSRYERDLKVKEICNQANIPLITFWTHGNQTNENIRYFIEKEIENAKRKTN